MTATARKAFAAKVHEAARKTPEAGKFGGTKVFIHAAWATSRSRLSLDAYKAALVEACRVGLVELCRLDMPEAFDPHDVRRSLARHPMGAEYHFVVLP